MTKLNVSSLFCSEVTYDHESNSLIDIIGINEKFIVNGDNTTDLFIVVILNGSLEEDGKIIFILESPNNQELSLGDFELSRTEDDYSVKVNYKYVFGIVTPFPNDGEYKLKGYFIPTHTIVDE